MKSKIASEFFKSGTYILLCGLITLLIWAFGNPAIGLLVFAILLLIVCCTSKSLIGILPPLVFATFMVNNGQDMLEPQLLIVFALAIITVIVALTIYMIKNKLKIKPSFANIAFCWLFVSSLLGGVTVGKLGNQFWLMGVGAMGVMFLAYLFLEAGIKEDIKSQVAKIMTVLTVILIAQVVIYYLREDDIMHAFFNKTIVVGWGISNSISLVLLLSAPFSLYLATQTKALSVIYYLIFALAQVAILATFSRGCIIIMVLSFLPITLFTIRYAKKPSLILISGAIFLIGALIAFKYYGEPIKAVISNMLDKGLSSSGRFELWEEGLIAWKESSWIFGSGFLDGSKFEGNPMSFFKWYHCAPLQFFSNLGLFGGFAYLMHMASKYIYFLKAKDVYSFFCIIGLFTSGLYTLIDVNIVPYYLIPMVVIMVSGLNNYKINYKKEDKNESKNTVCA